VCTGSTFADSIIIGLSPNNGTGDNFGFRLSGPGLVISIDGGVDVGYFNDLGYAPGSTLGGTTTVFFSSDTTTIRIGDTTYDLGQTGQGSTLFITNFTLPDNGKNFAIQVQATFFGSLLYFDANGQLHTFDISRGAPGTMTFTWDPSLGLYFANPVVFSTATVTPEPGSLGLMVTGLISMLGVARRRLRI